MFTDISFYSVTFFALRKICQNMGFLKSLYSRIFPKCYKRNFCFVIDVTLNSPQYPKRSFKQNKRIEKVASNQEKKSEKKNAVFLNSVNSIITHLERVF